MSRRIAQLGLASVGIGVLLGCSTPAYTLTWVEGEPLPEGLDGAGFVWSATGGGILIGGQTVRDGEPVVLDEVRYFDPTAALQVGPPAHVPPRLPPLPRRLAYAGTALLGNDLYVVGGSDGDLAAGDFLRLVRNSEGQLVWQSLPKLPEPRVAAAVAAVGDTLHVMGGAIAVTGPQTEAAEHFRYDRTRPEAGWVTLGEIPGPPRRAIGTAVSQDRIFLFGGLSEDADGRRHVFAHAYRYSALQDEWLRLADLPAPLYAPAVAAVGDRYILIVGGGSTAHVTTHEKTTADLPSYRTTAYLYDTATDHYRELASTPLPIRPGAVAVLGEFVFLIGGRAQPKQTAPPCDTVLVARAEATGFRLIR